MRRWNNTKNIFDTAMEDDDKEPVIVLQRALQFVDLGMLGEALLHIQALALLDLYR